MTEKFIGSCQCMMVRYKIDGSFESFYLCHCTYCQKDSGSGHSANLFSTTATLSWMDGQDKVKTYNIPSTRHVKSFCIDCGSALPNLQMEGKLLVVPAGSLDSKIAQRPSAHIFCTSRASWDNDLESLNKFENFPS